MATVMLTINDRRIEASSGQSVLQVARGAGIEIPTLCYHPDLSPAGSCRLCLVEVEGRTNQTASCTLPVISGMKVRTETPALTQSRKMVLGYLLSHYHDAGYTNHGTETEFMQWVRRYGAQPLENCAPAAFHPVDSDPNPFVWVDLNKCILCTRCVRACREIQGRFVWGISQRGHDTSIAAGAGTTMLDARCESCGACSAYCPTGALDDKPSIARGRADKTVPTVCPYCGVGCTFDVNVRDNTIVQITSRADAPVNGMSLCVKGRYGYEFVHHSDRLVRPRVRQYLLAGTTRDPSTNRGDWVEVDWETALNITATRLHAIVGQSGPDAVGVLSSAKCTNEENYLMQKFARQVIGTNNVDHCARLCHSSTVAGLTSCFGSGAMSNTMRDVAEQARAMFIIGSNVTEQHPVFGTMIRQSVLRRGTKLVVADPRRIDIAEFAALHLRHRPGTDAALVNGIMHIVLKNEWHDQQFVVDRCEDFDAFSESLEKYNPELVAEITGVSVVDLQQASKILACERPMAVIWAMGITQHTTGVLNVLSLGNLQMLLGNMGVPGGGVNPLRGQNNVQGACDMGALNNVLPGYQRVTDPQSRKKFEAAWQLAAAEDQDNVGLAVQMNDSPGLTVTEMIDAAGQGRVRALYILGENPAMTDPDLNHVRQCLEACEFLVLQEIFPSETSQYADVLLPGVSWAEKDGTFTNTERRVQLVRQAIQPRGEAQPDWVITTKLANRLLARQRRTAVGEHAEWNYSSASEVMEEIAALTPSYAGISHDRLNRGEQLHWPVPSHDHPGTPILHVGQFARGRGKFHVVDHLPPSELPDDEYPIVLTTGRVLYHWHGGELTRRVAGLLAIYPEGLVEISPEDAIRIGLNGRNHVQLTSRRGKILARAVITDRVSPGLVFANFHFPAEQNANNLTIGALDPVAKIPEYKVCAVRLEATD